MSLLNLSEVSFHYPSTPDLFRNATFAVDTGDRLAVVGPNGTGKSSLLKLLSGALDPTGGHIVRRRGLRIACVEQEMRATSGTLLEYVLSASNDPEDYAAESRAERILQGLSLSPEQLVTPLSGGERTRASLARALFTPCDLLLLDEPTNHLDIQGREWLEAEFARRESACVLVSHDRTLLKRVATGVIEIVRGVARAFPGDYDEYVARRALLERQAWENYEGFQRRKAAAEQASERRAALAVKVATPPPGVKTSQDFYGHKAAKVARTARILKERITREEQVLKPWVEQPIPDLDFSCVRRSGDLVLSVVNLAKSFADRELFRGLTFHVARGERIAIAGANGSGKTTLVRMLLGLEPPCAGEIRLGANVEIAYLAQGADFLDSQRAAQEICGASTLGRTLLGCLKVRPDRIARPVSELSPGERVKVALAQMLASGANLLILDEPTNHLEVEAQAALEQALVRFPGSIVIVSHDRTFISHLDPRMVTL